ncbi:hypothetical protein [Cypionkella aquatica]|nr:hypothetical protein [Cypionkella aquatica]
MLQSSDLSKNTEASALTAPLRPVENVLGVKGIANPQAPSRSGDRYHYVRAARLCLTMLAARPTLKKVVIEGAAADDRATGGEDVIDLALYSDDRGGEGNRIAYRQFKHSLLAADEPMTASHVIVTLQGFAARFQSVVLEEAATEKPMRHEFEFETNRPISPAVEDALQELREGRATTTSAYLRRSLPLKGDDLQAFAQRVRLLPRTASLSGERIELNLDVSAYLPDADGDVPTRLVEMIADKAAKPNAPDLEITRLDVLRQMDCDEHALRPAPSLLKRPSGIISRPILADLLDAIVQSTTPVILEAEGGVGKSVAATQLPELLPEGSVCVVYDCFANGSYRDPSQPRQQPRQAFVQMANELAFQGLCDPLIPFNRATEDSYARAFLARMGQAALSVAATPGAVVMLIIDAADNAEMVASERKEAASFARGLLRMTWPERVRIVLTTRPERRALLEPPPSMLHLVLPPFNDSESASHLRSRYPAASDTLALGFHRLTSANPRLQRVALDTSEDLDGLFDHLGPRPLTIQDAIEGLLNKAVAEVRDKAGPLERDAVDRICRALAVLRPFVPLDVVAQVAGVEPSSVHSLASELGRALIINDGAAQFSDEPTETWFRQNFRPDINAVRSIIERLRPLTKNSAYASAALPQLLLEAGEINEVIKLVLEDVGLPASDELGRRDVRAMRLRAATQAALRSCQYADVAKLAFRTANVEAAETRQLGLISRNPDLAARFITPEAAAELVARRKIGGGNWQGSDNAHQAALFAGYERFHGDAVGRLHTAWAWLENYFRRRHEAENDRSQVEINDEIVAMAWAQFELWGPESCAAFLRTWRPRNVSFLAGRAVCARLADAGRYDDLQAVVVAAGNDIFLGLAGTLELYSIGLTPSAATIRRLFRMVADRRVDIGRLGLRDHERTELVAIVALSVAALKSRAVSQRSVTKLLNRFVPPVAGYELDSSWHDSSGRRDALLKGFALRAILNGRSLTIDRLRDRKGRKNTSSGDHRQRESVAPILPWYVLWAEVTLGRARAGDVSNLIAQADKETSKIRGQIYRDHDGTLDDRLMLRAELLQRSEADAAAWGAVDSWYPTPTQKGQRASIRTVATIIRRAARNTALHGFALDLASRSAETLGILYEMAESTIDAQLLLARALLSISEPEAQAHFNAASDGAERLGEENHDRWNTLLSIATVAGRTAKDQPELAYRLARFAEPTHEHLGKSSYLDWERTVRSLARLSPNSSLGILSRWADRGFGIPDDELHVVLRTLVDDGVLSGDLAMLMFSSHDQNPASALADGLDAGVLVDAVHDIARRYVSVEDRSEHIWREVRSVATRYGIYWPWLDDVANASIMAVSRDQTQVASTPAHEPDWQNILLGVDLATADGLQEVIRRAKSEGGPRLYECWRVLPKWVPAGKEAGYLAALAQMDEFSLYELFELLDRIPTTWLARMAVPAAMEALVRTVVRRSPYQITFASWWMKDQTMAKLAKMIRTTEASLAQDALQTIAEEERLGSAADLFHIASLAAHACTPDDAASALGFALAEMDDALNVDDGDGPWRQELVPQGTVIEVLSDYLWSMLGSPDVKRRWRAAHAVRCLVRWGPECVLQRLCQDVSTGKIAALQDHRLPFYRLHAEEWLLVALERVAVDAPQCASASVGFLAQKVKPDEKHARLRGLAAGILQRLNDAGIIDITSEELARLGSINTDRSRPSVPKPEEALANVEKGGRLYFHYDSRDSLLRPLSSAFKINEDDASKRLEPIMRKLATNEVGNVLATDPRRERGIIRNDDYHGRRGRQPDDWWAYISRHAVMTLCGQLLDGDTPGNGNDGYFGPAGFLARQGLSSPKGSTWAADRREAVPNSCRLITSVPSNAWLAQISEVDPEALVELSDELCIWGRWTARSGSLLRSVTVSSALVSRGTAPALVRALETVEDPHAYRLPDSDQHFEIGVPGYVLRGWVSDNDAMADFDARDPWAGDLPLGTLKPRSWIANRFGINDDKEDGRWTCNDPTHFMRRQSWSTGERYGDEETDRGDRLLASRAIIDKICGTTGMALLREVTVTHDLVGKNTWDGKMRNSKVSLRLIG